MFVIVPFYCTHWRVGGGEVKENRKIDNKTKFNFEIQSALQQWDRERKDATCTDTHYTHVCQLPKYNRLYARARPYTLALITDAVYAAAPVQDLNYPAQSYFP